MMREGPDVRGVRLQAGVTGLYPSLRGLKVAPWKLLYASFAYSVSGGSIMFSGRPSCRHAGRPLCVR